VELGEEGEVAPTGAGRIASVYYLQHTTMAIFAERLHPDMDLHVRLCSNFNMGCILILPSLRSACVRHGPACSSQPQKSAFCFFCQSPCGALQLANN